jgi:hypothetical protein
MMQAIMSLLIPRLYLLPTWELCPQPSCKSLANHACVVSEDCISYSLLALFFGSRSDGQEINAPTVVLMTKFINNIRRSGNMGESIYIDVNFSTPTEKILELRQRMQDFLAVNSRDFQPGFDIKINEIVQLNTMNLLLYLEYKGNWQDGGRRWERRTRFMYALKDALVDLDIKYDLPTQNVVTSQAPEISLQAETPQSFSSGIKPRYRQNTSSSFPDVSV